MGSHSVPDIFVLGEGGVVYQGFDGAGAVVVV